MPGGAAAGPRGQAAPRPHRWLRIDPATVLIAIGWGSIVVGGLVAAVTRPLELARGSWLAAYLVLVVGVAQCAMGYARSWLGARGPSDRRAWVQIATWNLGNAAVIVGTLGGRPLVVDVGAVLLCAALAVALGAARSGAGGSARTAGGPPARLAVSAYRALLLVLALSVPVGIVLSHLQHG